MEKPDVQFKLRLPADLKLKLEEAADIEGRSLSAEIVQRLEASFPNIEQELLSQRMHELGRLRMALDRAQDELHKYLVRREKRDWAPFGQEWLEDVIQRGQGDVDRISAMLARVQSDISAVIGST